MKMIFTLCIKFKEWLYFHTYSTIILFVLKAYHNHQFLTNITPYQDQVITERAEDNIIEDDGRLQYEKYEQLSLDLTRLQFR